eukprot:GSMAST32.ASY1.ANO1.339.1 assembled CDS
MKVHHDPSGGIFFEIRLDDGKIIGTIAEKLSRWKSTDLPLKSSETISKEVEDDDSIQSSNFRQRVKDFYTKHAKGVLEEAPDKLDKLMVKYSGMESELMEALHTKYNVPYSPEDQDDESSEDESELEEAIKLSLVPTQSASSSSSQSQVALKNSHENKADSNVQNITQKHTSNKKKLSTSVSSDDTGVEKNIYDNPRISLAMKLISTVVTSLHKNVIYDAEHSSEKEEQQYKSCCMFDLYNIIVKSICSSLVFSATCSDRNSFDIDETLNTIQSLSNTWRSIIRDGKNSSCKRDKVTLALRSLNGYVCIYYGNWGMCEHHDEWIKSERSSTLETIDVFIQSRSDSMNQKGSIQAEYFTYVAQLLASVWWSFSESNNQSACSNTSVSFVDGECDIREKLQEYALTLSIELRNHFKNLQGNEDDTNVHSFSRLKEQFQCILSLSCLLPLLEWNERCNSLALLWKHFESLLSMSFMTCESSMIGKKYGYTENSSTTNNQMLLMRQMKVLAGVISSSFVSVGTTKPDFHNSNTTNTYIIPETVTMLHKLLSCSSSELQASAYRILSSMHKYKVQKMFPFAFTYSNVLKGTMGDSISTLSEGSVEGGEEEDKEMNNVIMKFLPSTLQKLIRQDLLRILKTSADALGVFSHTDSDGNVTNTDKQKHELYGICLAWLIVMGYVIDSPRDSMLRPAINKFVKCKRLLPSMLELCLIWLLPDHRHLSKWTRPFAKDLKLQSDVFSAYPMNLINVRNLANKIIVQTARAMPAEVRSWWSENISGLSRNEIINVERYFAACVTPALVRSELFDKDKSNTSDQEECIGSISIRGSLHARSIIAEYKTDDCTLEICLQLAMSHPLQLPEVTCERRLGVKDKQWRRWALQIRRLLSAQDGAVGSVVDAVELWKQNLDKEFSGVEPCPICYNVLHMTHRTLPSRSCKTCNTCFHSHCLYKWFQSSQKSSCPLCRAAF